MYWTKNNPSDLDNSCLILDNIRFQGNSLENIVHPSDDQIQHDYRKYVTNKDYDHPEVVDVGPSAQYADVVDELDLRHYERGDGEPEQGGPEHILLEQQDENDR